MLQHPTTDATSTSSRPFLKWAGGKQRLLHALKARLPLGKRLIEPFLGAGSVFLGTAYPQYLLGDANPDLMAVWAALQSRPRDFIERASGLFTSQNWSEDSYYLLRDEYNRQTDRFERAVLFVYLNRFGFNGVYRVNSKGALNTPYGKPRSMPGFPWDELSRAAEKLSRATLHAGGFQFAMEQAGEGDVVYCDPPYSSVDQPSFTAYTHAGFGVEQHERLRHLAEVAVERGTVVAISNHDSPHTRALYTGWSIHELTVTRTVSAQKNARQPAHELLAVLQA